MQCNVAIEISLLAIRRYLSIAKCSLQRQWHLISGKNESLNKVLIIFQGILTDGSVHGTKVSQLGFYHFQNYYFSEMDRFSLNNRINTNV